jgi:hypothetical protein
MGGRQGFDEPMRDGGRPLAFAKGLLALLIFSLGFNWPRMFVAGFVMFPTDFVFVALAGACLVAAVTGALRPRWERGYWVMLIYFAALGSSLLVSERPETSALKMATQFYLAGLAVVACSLTSDIRDIRFYVRSWLMATALVAFIAALSLGVFLLDPRNPLLDFVRFQFGSLPPGHYPRFRLTFVNANMLCNYLSVSFALLLVAIRLEWLGKAAFLSLLVGIGLSAAVTISPGIGGILLIGGVWSWMRWKERERLKASLALAAGFAAALLFVLATAITPIIHQTVPFTIKLPGIGLTLAPAARMMTWISATRNFLAHPLLGHGIGIPAASFVYRQPGGALEFLSDAHNTFLNIAAQCGIVGLAALLLLIFHIFERTRPFGFSSDDGNVLRLGLGIAFLGAFAYQGLGGSFEDARHLWVLFGLFVAAIRIEEETRRRARPATPPRIATLSK